MEWICQGEWQEPACGVGGDGDGALRESGKARQHPSFKAMERGKLKAPGHFAHSDEIPSTPCACL